MKVYNGGRKREVEPHFYSDRFEEIAETASAAARDIGLDSFLDIPKAGCGCGTRSI